MDIDWAKFAERVPAGTRIRYDMKTDMPLHVEGVLIERAAAWDLTAHIIHYPSGRLSQVPYDYPADQMEYFINNIWLTFEQVMSDAS